jgi:cell division protein FtsL
MSVLADIFERRVRGFRVVEVVALACLVLLVFWVYLTKAGAGAERGEIASIEKEIREQQGAVKLLRAEAAHLEQPARIEALSEGYLGLKPVEPKKEAQPDTLEEVARVGGAGSR